MGSQKRENRPSIARAQLPDEGQPKLIPVVSPKTGAAVRAILLGHHFQGFWIHWDQNRTRPCVDPRELCAYCASKLARRWKGYCQAYSPGQNRLVIVEITAEVARRLPILTNQREGLEGREIVVERLGTSRTGPCRARLEVRTHQVERIGSFDLFNAMCRVWGLDSDLYRDADGERGNV